MIWDQLFLAVPILALVWIGILVIRNSRTQEPEYVTNDPILAQLPKHQVTRLDRLTY